MYGSLFYVLPILAVIAKTVFRAVLPLLIGCMIAYVVNILMCFYEKGYARICRMAAIAPLQRPLCMTLSYLSLVLVILILWWMIVPQLLSCIRIIATGKKIRYVLTVLNQSFHHFLAGQTIEAVILGMLCTIGMWILRLPYAAMIGCLVGVTALLPVIGAYIGAAAGACMLLTVSPVKALVFLIFLTILQQIEGNFIYPRVVGHSIGLPGIWVLAAVIVGGGAFGIWGILFAVPLAAAIYRLLRPSIN